MSERRGIAERINLPEGLVLKWVLSLVVFLGVFTLVSTDITMAAEPLKGLMACRAVPEATERLACFDRESAALDVKAASLAVSAGPATPPPVPALDPQKQFGLPERTVASQEVAAGTRAADSAKVEAHLVQFSQSQDGRGVFTLDNAQVWRQLNATGDLLIRLGDEVTISRAALGSYWLQTKTGRGCKVTRLR